MSSLNVNIPLIEQTAAAWAADATVYPVKRFLITSDVFFTGTDQKKFKITNGVDTWANLDYVPIGIANTLAQVLAAGNNAGGVTILQDGQMTSVNGVVTIDLGSGLYLGLTTDSNGYTTPYLFLQPGVESTLGYDATKDVEVNATGVNLNHTNDINLNAPNVVLLQQPPSKILAADSGKNVVGAYDFSTDGTLAGNSDTTIPSEKAIKSYADNLLSTNDALVFKGVIDASTNPNYPAADIGWTYKISVAGKIGGASGVNVEIGDTIYCIVDGSPAGTQAAVGAYWDVIQGNMGVVHLAGNESITGVKTFDKDCIIEKGTSTGVTTLSTANTGATNYSLIMPAKDGTLSIESEVVHLAGNETITGSKTFDKDTIITKGTSTGTVTLSNANTGASNFVQTLQATTDTIATSMVIVPHVDPFVTAVLISTSPELVTPLVPAPDINFNSPTPVYPESAAVCIVTSPEVPPEALVPPVITTLPPS